MAPTNNPQEFLNSLELGEVTDFVSDLFARRSYLDLVNYKKHFKSLSITLEQLVTMKNAREEQHPDGAFFKRWMECKIREKHMNQAPAKHPDIIIRRHGRA
ncbi:unnamed protein product [Adineta steineri]|uniref:Uncharacterized protein n=1 Tax=Adineta steineri TaxID=433720 RepID=A0A814HCU8_9BILA|nr:unnamed protein product [Adineta steineri]CAF3633018.1 unnamed protein product [Adineta steineri]